MKILLCHNYYQQPGGEDRSFEAEATLLREHGHQVEMLTTQSSDIEQLSRVATAARTIWNRDAARRVRTVVSQLKPDVTHFTNTFPLLSPAAVSAARSAGGAVVVALRNYRLICPKANLWRNGSLCQMCVAKTFATPAVRYGCYRSSSVSAVLTIANAAHRFVGASSNHVDLFFTLSAAARSHFVAGGIPAERIVVKPNFVSDPSIESHHDRNGAVFVGRLTPEKGVHELLAAWSKLKQDVPLQIFGDGPLSPIVQAAAKEDSRITAHGAVPGSVVTDALRRADFAIVPSLWPEPFGRVVIEAFSVGTPVVGSNRGAIPELLAGDPQAAIFDPTDPRQLTNLVSDLVNDQPRLAALRQSSRAEYETNYTPQAHYPKLMNVYEQAIENRRQRTSQSPEPASLKQPVPDKQPEKTPEKAHEPTC